MAVAQALAREQDEQQQGQDDPALDPVEQIRAQMQRMIDTTSEFTVARLTGLRDRVDQMMREHQAHQAELLASVTQFAEDCAATIECEKVMSETLDTMVKRLGARAGATVTQLQRRRT